MVSEEHIINNKGNSIAMLIYADTEYTAVRNNRRFRCASNLLSGGKK